MFNELPLELKQELLSFISPPKWADSMGWVIGWAKNILCCKNETQVSIKLQMSVDQEEYGPNLMGGWEVHPSLVVQRHEEEDGKIVFWVDIMLLFEHWHDGEAITNEVRLDQTQESRAPDLLRYCPRSVTNLPKNHYVCPMFYRLGQGLVHGVLRSDFGDILDYRTSHIENGPGELLRLI